MMIHRWMKGALNAPDGKRPHSPRMGKTEGKHQKAGVVRHSRHEGLAPVRLSIGLETGSGSFAGEFLPDIGSIGLSFSAVLGASGLRGRRVPFSRSTRLRGRQVGRKRRPSVRDHKNGASPSPRSKRPGELEMKTKETTHEPHANGQRRRRPAASFEAGSGAEIKKGPGGRRKPLIRLDSAKEIQGFSLLYFVRALLDEARIWLNLGLAWKKFGFPSCR